MLFKWDNVDVTGIVSSREQGTTSSSSSSSSGCCVDVPNINGKPCATLVLGGTVNHVSNGAILTRFNLSLIPVLRKVLPWAVAEGRGPRGDVARPTPIRHS